MKKKIFLGGAALVAICLGVAGMSAFEAHVLNVTADIQNALTVPVETSGLSFGSVIPEEVLHKNLDIQLSQSFLDEARVDDVSYMIRQKPKCGVPIPDTDPVQYSSFVQVKDNPDGSFACPDGSVMLPLLCSYLSKHELDDAGAPMPGGIDAFHGPLTGWTLTDTINYQVLGHLSKIEKDTSDTWDIDLHVPCYKGECAQDKVIPKEYEVDIQYKNQMFGCDLWIEVTDISYDNTKLIVVKHVDNANGGTAVAGDFTMTINGINANPQSFPGAETPGITVPVTPGSYTVTETGPAGYLQELSADCSGTIASGETKTCTITNTYQPPKIIVNKVLEPADDSGRFDLQIDGVTAGTGENVGNGGTTGEVAVAPGPHTVGEIAHSGTDLDKYTIEISGDCDPSGGVNVAAGETKTCTIKNTKVTTTITVNKVTVPADDSGKFNLLIDSTQYATDIANGGTTGAQEVTVGAHTASEEAGTGTNLGNYITTFTGDCNAIGEITIAKGEHKECTITNTHTKGYLKVVKEVINNDVGIKQASDFQMQIDGVNVEQNVDIEVYTGTRVVSEADTLGYDVTFSGDCDSSGHVTVTEGSHKTCTVTNDFPTFTVTVTKNVVNNNGGNNTAEDFILFIGSQMVPSGQPIKVAVGSHQVTESGVEGYAGTLSGDCDPQTQLVTGGKNDVKSCILTNDDISPSIRLVKNVIGGTALPTDFIMRVNGSFVPHNGSTLVNSNTAHTITEDAKAGYTFTSMAGVGSQGSVCPTTLGGTITLNEGEVITCTITNTYTGP